MEFFKAIQKEELQNSRIAAFSSTRKPGVSVKQDVNLKALLDSGAPCATLVGKSWDFHVLKALETTPEENLNMIRESIAYKDKKRKLSWCRALDGFKANEEYAVQVLQAAQEAEQLAGSLRY